MKFIFITILLLSVFLVNLSAEDSYKRIIITKTINENSLNEIKSKLDQIGVAMFLKKSLHNNNYYYYVYSKKYNYYNNMVNSDLKKIKTIFKSAYIIEKKPKIIYANSNQTTEEIIDTALSNYFLTASVGYASISGTNSSSTVDITSSGLSFAIEGGYIFYDNIYTSLGYSSISNSDLSLNDIYLSSYYQFDKIKNSNFYAGLLLGYSTLELNNFSYTQSSKSSSLGIQLGFKYNFDKNIAFFTDYKGILIDHIIKVVDDNSEIKFSFIHNVEFGVLYRF